MGLVSAILVMAGFLTVLWRAGWAPGDPTGPGTSLNHAYREATTATFAGIVACQIGTAFASRTESASLCKVGLLTNPLLLWGIAFEVPSPPPWSTSRRCGNGSGRRRWDLARLPSSRRSHSLYGEWMSCTGSGSAGARHDRLDRAAGRMACTHHPSSAA